MAQYQDFPLPSADPAAIYQQIAALLVGAYSVELVPSGNSIILRVWLNPHCDQATHMRT